MAKRQEKSGMQWKVVQGLSLAGVASACEEWTGKGWHVFAILGPLNSGIALVLNRMLIM